MHNPRGGRVGPRGCASFREPLHVPLARALDVPHNNLEGVKVQCCHRIERDVEENEGPLEEGVDCVSYMETRKSARPRPKIQRFHGLVFVLRPAPRFLPPATRWTLCWMKK